VHPIVATVIQRLFLGIATLFVVSIIIFSSIEMLPGDFGQAVLGQAATEETVAAFRKELGLDKPAYIRYFDWVAGVIQGDLGTSFSGRAASGVDRSRPVAELIAPRLWNTLFLAGHDSDYRGPACTIFRDNSGTLPRYLLRQNR
jgi:peptide/nickel transport system permease protein